MRRSVFTIKKHIYMHKIYHTSAYVKINSCAAPGRRFLNFTSADNLILFVFALIN